MKAKFVLVVALLSISHAGKCSEHKSSSSDEKGQNAVGGRSDSIAKGSTNQAYIAPSQQHADINTGCINKISLAQSAIQAAALAQAALADKQDLLETLEQQSADAHRALKSEASQLQSAIQHAAAATKAAEIASNHVSMLTSVINSAQNLVQNADKVENLATTQISGQNSLINEEQNRFNSLLSELEATRVDYEATKDAAEIASLSAQEAQRNADAAAAQATAKLHEAALKATNSSVRLEINSEHHHH